MLRWSGGMGERFDEMGGRGELWATEYLFSIMAQQSSHRKGLRKGGYHDALCNAGQRGMY